MTDQNNQCLCGAALDSDRLRCSGCRAVTNKSQKEIYAERKAKRQCTWCGEAAMVMPDGSISQFCRPHRIKRNKYIRDRKTRLEREAEKKERSRA